MKTRLCTSSSSSSSSSPPGSAPNEENLHPQGTVEDWTPTVTFSPSFAEADEDGIDEWLCEDRTFLSIHVADDVVNEAGIVNQRWGQWFEPHDGQLRTLFQGGTSNEDWNVWQVVEDDVISALFQYDFAMLLLMMILCLLLTRALWIRGRDWLPTEVDPRPRLADLWLHGI